MASDPGHQSGETQQGKTRTNSRRRADDLRQSLEREIFSGILLPGERLDESSLARRFEVSRTPVREVDANTLRRDSAEFLTKLSEEGLVSLEFE